MKIIRDIIHAFEDNAKDAVRIKSIDVPVNSKFLRAKVLHDGIYAFYSMPDEDFATLGQNSPTRNDKFFLGKNDDSYPNNAEYIDILDLQWEIQEGEKKGKVALVLFYLFKLP